MTTQQFLAKPPIRYQWANCSLKFESNQLVRLVVLQSSDGLEPLLGLMTGELSRLSGDELLKVLTGISLKDLVQRGLDSGGFRVGFRSESLGQWFNLYIYPMAGRQLSFLYVPASGMAAVSLASGLPGSVLEMLPMPVQVMDEAGVTRYVNQAFRNLFGDNSSLSTAFLADQQLQAQGVTTIANPVWEGKTPMVTASLSYHTNSAFSGMDDDPLYLELTLFPIPTYEGESRFFIAFYHDVSERYRAVLQFKSAEERSRITLRSIGDAVISTDREGKVTAMNTKAETLTGWNESEALNRPLNEVFRIVNAQSRLEIKNPVEEVLARGVVVGLANHTVLISRQGTEYQIADSAAPILNNDQHVEGVVLVFRDVTFEYKAAEALAESNQRYKAVFTWVPVGIVHYDSKGVIYDANEEFIRIIGSSRELLIGLNMLQKINDHDILRGVRESLAGQPSHYEGIYHSVTAEKSTPVRGDFVGIPGADGSMIGGIGMFEDISARIAIENELRYKNSAFEASLAGNSIADVNGNLIAVNRAFVEMMGYRFKDEVLGLPILHFFRDEDVGGKMLDRLRTEGELSGVFVARRADGSAFQAQSLATTLTDEKGNLTGFQSSLVDITAAMTAETALRESEDKFRSIAENANDLISLLDDSGHYLYCNQAYLRVLGYDPSWLVGRNAFDLVHPDEKDEIIEYFTIVQRTSDSLGHHLTFRLLTADGSFKWVEHRTGQQIATAKGLIRVLTATDVTERLMNKRQLDQSEVSFADVFNSVSEAIYIQDEEGVFLDVNQSAELMYGLSRSELVGKTPEAIAAPGLNDMEKLRRLTVNVFQNGAPERFEFWGRRSNGHIFPKEVILNKGHYFGREVLIAVARDISKQKETEKLLQNTITRHEALLNANPDMMFVFDADYIITDYHAEQSSELLYPPEVFLNRKVDDVLPAHLVQLTHQMVDVVLQTRELQIAVYDIDFQGKLCTYESRYAPCGENEVVAIVRNITDQKNNEALIKESEERYRALADNAFQGILILSLEGTILSANHAMIRILECESEAEVVGMSATEFILPESIEQAREDFANVARGVDSYVSEYHCRTSKNNPVWIESIGKVIEYKGGKANVVSIRDITGIKRTADAVTRRDQLLQAVARIAQLLLSEGDFMEALRKTVSMMGTASGMDRVYYFSIAHRDFGPEATIMAEWVNEGVSRELDNPVFSHLDMLALAPDYTRELLGGNTLIVCVNDLEGATRELFLSQNVFSLSLVPVLSEGSLMGLLGFDNCHSCYQWTPGEIDAYTIVGSLIGSYLQRIAHEKHLRESEAKYRLLAENTDDVIWMMDLNYRYHFISPSIEKMLGFTPEEIISGQFGQWMTPESASFVAELFESCVRKIAAGEELQIEVFRTEQYHRDGSTVWTEMNVSAVYDEAGKFLYFLGVTRDISGQIEKERALATSEAEKATLLRAIPDQLVVFDDDEKLLEVYNSPSQTNILPEMIGKSVEEIYPETIALQFREAMSLIQHQGDAAPFYLVMKIGGDDKHFQVKVLPVANRYLAVIRDVTREQEAVLQLRNSEQKYKSLQELFRKVADNMPDMLWAKDMDKRFIFVNHSICTKLLNATSIEEPIGKDDMFFALRERELHPNDPHWHTFGELCVDSDKIVMSTGQPGTFEESGNIRGKFLCLDVVKSPLRNERGEITGTVGAARDITQRVRDEQIRKVQYNIARAVVEATHLGDFIEIVRLQVGELVDATNFYIALYDETTGMCKAPYFSDEADDIQEWPAHRSATGLVIETGQPTLLQRHDFHRMAEEGIIEIIGVIPESWLGVPLRTGNTITGAFVVQSYHNPDAYNTKDMEILSFLAHNISLAVQKFRSDELLREALQRAQESDRLKSAFMANMSHEIRTPLNGILGFSNLLADNPADMEEVKYYSSIISKSGNRLLELINNIIDISRVEAGITTIELSAVSPVEAISDVINQFSIQARNQHILLRSAAEEGMKNKILFTDSLRLHQVLTNLVNNALKFTPQGFVEVGCFAEVGKIGFFVKDSGIGIPPDKLPHIFERFYQVDNSYSRGHEGVGLGLSLCRSFVELLGGTLHVDSEPGAGSTFTFYLPDKGLEDEPASREVTITVEKPSMNEAMVKVLVVEDDQVNIEYLSAVLTKAKANLFVTHNYDETLAWFDNEANPIPDLILMDIKLPGKDGLSLTREIKARFPDIPIVALTAFASSTDREKALKAGCSKFVTKPVTRETLLQIVAELTN